MNAQNTSKAFQLIEEKNHSKAEEILKEAYSKGKDKLIAKYGLAIIYSDTAYEKFSLIKAYKSINYVKNKFDKEENHEMLEQKFNINIKNINNLSNKICENAFSQIENKNSIPELNNFINIYSESDFTQKIIGKRDSIEYFGSLDSGNFKELQNFYTQRPQSKYADAAKEKYEKQWKSIYEQYASYGEYEIILEFEQKYPDYPFYNTLSTKNKTLAAQAKKLNLEQEYQSTNQAEYLKYIEAAAPRETAYLALMKMIRPELKNKNYEKAIQILEKNIMYFGGDDKRIKNLISILKEPETGIKAQGISPIINTDAWEYSVVESADGNKIYFCGRNRPDNLAPQNEDIFVSVKKNNSWTKPILLKDINTIHGHEAPLAVTTDGNILLLYTNSDIYFSEKIKGGWGPKNAFPNINTANSWEADAMITADGKAIFFISDRKGNIGIHRPFGQIFHGKKTGNTDIYVSVKTNNKWSEPINIGNIVNTPFAERGPFLHSDMKTMYFSSDGHGGLGEFDVFMTKRLSDTSWTQWSEPINLGKEINTQDDELGYKISTDGTKAYFAGLNNNNFDIFYVSLPQKMRPENVSVISGTIKDLSGNPLHAEIKWEDLNTGEIVGFLKSNPDDGTYIIILPNGKNYGFFVEKELYYPTSGNINLINEKKNYNISKDIILYSYKQILTENVSIPLQNLFFEYNKFEIKKESYPELNRLAKFIQKQSGVRVEISGHTDNKGVDLYNIQLSKDRANEVRKYLISKGCSESSLTASGYGSSKPLMSNETENGRAANRRVEFKIVK